MNTLTKFLSLGLLLLSLTSLQAQVGIGTTSPESSAALEIKSTTQGLLPPRMTTNERDLIDTPVPGLLVYNTTTKKLQLFTTVEEQQEDVVIANTTINNGGTCMTSGNLWFTPNISGTLNEVKLNTSGTGETASLVIMDVSSCDNTSTVLGNSNSVNMVAGWNTWTFSTPVEVVAGTTYFISSNDATGCLGVKWSDSGDDSRMGNVMDDDFMMSCTNDTYDIAAEIRISQPDAINTVWVNLN
ncbi:DUF4082 domain-containing protein [Psychroflexus maritimus]|uniref:DUF4082 domain-containing protein n=1 Tax=Psychroflexus maritimus TaxID=2714865 RepID=A0A967E6Y5_9FLAO|nr:DUF4082 domain-containing protein [Psychroflexus maritimus]NGZ90216.1 DUF4082 domain-containing protein [Psychroflexus maritimus]